MRAAAIITKYKIHHVFFWLLVGCAWFLLREKDYASRSQAMLITLIKTADLALLIYIANYVLVPRLLYKKKYLLFAGCFLLMVFASSAIKLNLLGRLQHNPGMMEWWKNFRVRVYDNFIPHFFLVIAGVATKLIYDYLQLQQRLAETAREKAEAELNFLKSQINPHFVFNSLNAVYFLIHKENAAARDALHKFSDMLRYQLYETNGKQLPIEKEIAYLKDYIDLQQLRKDDRYRVQFTIDPAVQGFSIEPLLLIPLVENAFKHISHFTDRINRVSISLQMQQGALQCRIVNTKEMIRTQQAAGGIGLANVRRRLELLYPNRHRLTVQEEPELFTVTLQLTLHAN